MKSMSIQQQNNETKTVTGKAMYLESTNTSGCMMLRRLCRTVPKTELHLHLDGSLSPEWVAAVAAPALGRAADVPPEYRHHLHAMKKAHREAAKRVGARQNWSYFDECNSWLQTEELLASAAQEVVSRLHTEHNVWYVEVRFCPTLHTLGGMSERDAVTAVVKGVEAAKAAFPDNLRGGVILCALRSHAVADAVRMAELAAEFLPRGVVGMDVAGDESAFPLPPFGPALDKAHALGVPVTVHAGEWPDTHDSLRFAVEHKAVHRVGHATVLRLDGETGEGARAAAGASAAAAAGGAAAAGAAGGAAGASAGASVHGADTTSDADAGAGADASDGPGLGASADARAGAPDGSAAHVADTIRRRGLTIEVCLTGNVGSKKVVSRFEDHPLRQWLDAGLSASLSSDNTLLSGSAELVASPSHEVRNSVHAGLEPAQVAQVLKCGPRGGFHAACREDSEWLARYDAAVDAAFAEWDGTTDGADGVGPTI